MTKKTGYFLFNGDLNADANSLSGIERKVKAQIDALNNDRLECKFLFYHMGIASLRRTKFSWLPWASEKVFWPFIPELGTCDFLYIRRPPLCSKDFIEFLKYVRLTNPGIKILFEIPTFPYDLETKGLKGQIKLLKDKIYRKELRKYIDYIVDLGGKDMIFGIPTIQIQNGVDLAEIEPRKTNDSHDEINMISPSSLEIWHGIDRLIMGLAEYYKNDGSRRIKVHIAGDGGCRRSLEMMSKEAGLEDRVIFHGRIGISKLNELYDLCNIGLECFGNARKGMAVSSSLKSREFLAKGLPFVYSDEIDVFNNSPVDFALQLSSGNDPLNMQEIVNFYDNLYQKEPCDSIIKRIRNYAERTVSMHIAMKDVIRYLEQ